MQESADNVSPDSTSPSKDALLEEACKKYDEATRLCPTLHDVCKDVLLYEVLDEWVAIFFTQDLVKAINDLNNCMCGLIWAAEPKGADP